MSRRPQDGWHVVGDVLLRWLGNVLMCATFWELGFLSGVFPPLGFALSAAVLAVLWWAAPVHFVHRDRGRGCMLRIIKHRWRWRWIRTRAPLAADDDKQEEWAET